VLLSSSSVFPEPTAAAFEMAATVGYDGLEVMVWTDAVSQDADALQVLSDHYAVPVLSVHAPCLLVTQRVWSPDPWERLSRAAQLAETLGAPTVVVHPPFSWQRDYAKNFSAGLARIQARHPDTKFAIENMFPVKMAGRWFVPYTPGWDPTETGFDAYTLDLSHCAASRIDSLDSRGFKGSVALEVSTRKVTSRAVREADLRESLEFARRHLEPAKATTPA
jgi:sugar phosphate isomerase/epimerase